MIGLVSRRREDGFTLVELLLAMTIGAILIAALVGALMLSLRTTFGLSSSATVTKQQDAQLVVVQLDADAGIQALTKTFATDIASVDRGSNIKLSVGLPGGCAPPATDPSLSPGSDTPLLQITQAADSSGRSHVVVYRYSTDAKQRFGQIVRYDCVAGSTRATLEVHGVSSTVTPSATGPTSAGLVSLALTTATGRAYRLDGQMRLNLDTEPSPGASPTPTPTLEQPVVFAAKLLDSNHNGRVDSIVASFNGVVDSTACKSGWAVAGLPAGASLSSVSITSNSTASTATLSLTEGAVDTSVGSTTVQFTPPSGCSAAAYPATAPTDGAAPVVMSVTDTHGLTAGKMEAGDTLSVLFSEPINGIATTTLSGTVTITNPNGSGTKDTLTVAWPASSPTSFLVQNQSLGATGYVKNNKTASCPGSIAASALNSRQVVVTVGAPCTDGNIQTNSTGGSFSLTPDSTMQDAAGNAAVANPTTTPGTLVLF